VFGTHGLACFERVLRRLADQLLYAADRQIASRVGPQLQRDEHQQGDGQVIDGDLCQQLSSAHALPPLVMLVFMPVMMVVMMMMVFYRMVRSIFGLVAFFSFFTTFNGTIPSKAYYSY